MSTLSEIFEQVVNQLQHGPSVEPFFRKIIASHDVLESRVLELEKVLVDIQSVMEKFLKNEPEIVSEIKEAGYILEKTNSSPEESKEEPEDHKEIQEQTTDLISQSTLESEIKDVETNSADQGTNPVDLPGNNREPDSAEPDHAE